MLIRGENNRIQPIGNQEPLVNGKLSRKPSRPDSPVPDESDWVSCREVGKSSDDKCTLEKAALQTRGQIRQRIENGFYQSEQVIRRIAEKLLDLFGL